MGVLRCSCLVVLASLAACAPPNFKDLCDKTESCAGGNDQDKAACIDQARTARKEADDVGCKKEFDDYTVCLIDSGTCRGTPIGLPCATNADCTKYGATCSANQCQLGHFGLDPKNTSCNASQHAYFRCMK